MPNKQILEALDAAITALDDWTNTYAPDFCDANRVEEAKSRLHKDGTLFYIATIVQQCKEAKELLNVETR